jgi:hypothetical protein
VSGKGAITRRQAVGWLTLPLIVGCEGAANVCIDRDLLGAGERQMRATLAYVDVSENVTQQCGNCQFFHHDAGKCGECEILDGPVNRAGYCSSWAEAKIA